MNLDTDSSDKLMTPHETNQINTYGQMSVSNDSPIRETLAQELSVVAAQLIEAACKARGGDFEATRAHIAHAIALLRGIPRLGPRFAVKSSNAETNVIRGGLPAWQMRKVIAHVEVYPEG
jgi:hypothetical protein